MKATLVKIGNSQGIRIPKPILAQCRLRDEVELEVQNGELIIRPVHQARQQWTQAFRKMAEFHDDVLMDSEGLSQTEWDVEEWEWT
ncbi:AbrB/MazE/SpoVT family DNA-binding domain-containing protein [candidate division KSB3 bacterium]|uniref:AbrB/MazE/SpoVT family DNA-binding domain-containing protein n=1 Tax=candidate division KSB3 bacterium TaxID=2044937 RepID=A0A2G6KBL9_9BACT|nr:MAG: AbrB/MazE/SpoVT family DNA-binding domain-containing protein [candidate division KSB3 bacterium]